MMRHKDLTTTLTYYVTSNLKATAAEIQSAHQQKAADRKQVPQ